MAGRQMEDADGEINLVMCQVAGRSAMEVAVASSGSWRKLCDKTLNTQSSQR